MGKTIRHDFEGKEVRDKSSRRKKTKKLSQQKYDLGRTPDKVYRARKREIEEVDDESVRAS